MSHVPSRHKKALIIGLNYTHNHLWKLKGAQNEIRAASSLLRDTYMFSANDVVVMSDYEGIHKSLIPTRANIIHQLDNFVVVGNENTDYIFIYAGHTDQFPDAMDHEEDGMAECIVPYDAIPLDDGDPYENKVVFDFELNQHMVARLGPGSRLTAIAASCHSATLLNLPHYRCNRPFRHLASKDGARHVFRRIVCNPLDVTVTKIPRRRRRSESPDDVTLPDSPRYVVKKRVCVGDPAQEQDQEICTGLCCLPGKAEEATTPTVVCISACKDGERTYENGDGNSMLQCIIDLLKNNNTPTLEEVMIHVQDNAEETYEAVRAHQKQHTDTPTRFHFFQRGSESAMAKRWEPQLSSTQPLNLKSKLVLCQMPTPSPPRESRRLYQAGPRL